MTDFTVLFLNHKNLHSKQDEKLQATEGTEIFS